jgi:hypothetical protein
VSGDELLDITKQRLRIAGPESVVPIGILNVSGVRDLLRQIAGLTRLEPEHRFDDEGQAWERVRSEGST